MAIAATGRPVGAKAARIQHHVLFALRAITSTCSVSSALLLARCGRIATMPTTRKRSRSQGSMTMPASGSASSRPSGSQWQRSQPMAPSTWSSSPSGLLSTGSRSPTWWRHGWKALGSRHARMWQQSGAMPMGSQWRWRWPWGQPMWSPTLSSWLECGS